MATKPMDELKSDGLKRPMDRNAMSNDMGVMKSLLSLLNNPLVTGAAPPPSEPAPAPPPSEPAPAPPPPPPPPPLQVEPPPITVAAVAAAAAPAPMKPTSSTSSAKAFALPGRSIFFTGAAKVGKSWLATSVGARIMELDDPIASMIRDVFPDARETDQLQREIFALGDGLVTQKYPLSAARMHFVASVRMMSNEKGLFGIDLRDFGTSGFWVKSLIARAGHFHTDFPDELLVVTDVWEPAQYSALRDAGFAPFHVMCNNITRSGRGGSVTVSPLVNGIERDITNKISQQPRGKKMWAVWCDPNYPPTSGRLLTVQEFITGVSL